MQRKRVRNCGLERMGDILFRGRRQRQENLRQGVRESV
jgi:hypothetical protein